jgi:hypothetical protein
MTTALEASPARGSPTVTAMARERGMSRNDFYRQKRIAGLTPEARALTDGKRWAGVDLLDALSEVSDQVGIARWLVETDPPTAKHALAMLGKPTPRYPVTKRRRVAEQAREARQRGELSGAAVAVIERMVEQPTLVTMELIEAGHRRAAIEEAEQFLKRRELRHWLYVPLPWDLVRYLENEVARRWPTYAKYGQFTETVVYRIIHEARRDSELLEAALQIGEKPNRNHDQTCPIHHMLKVLRGMGSRKLKQEATISRNGGPASREPSIRLVPLEEKYLAKEAQREMYGGWKVPRRSTHWEG